MSLSNILQPNGYDLYCNSITTAISGSPMVTTNQGYSNTADFSFSAGTVTNVLWDSNAPPIAGLPAFPLTYDAGTGRFTNNTGKPVIVDLTYQAVFKDVVSPSTNNEIGIIKNGGSAVESIVRYGGLAWASATALGPSPNAAITFPGGQYGLSTSWTGSLAQGEFFNPIVYQNQTPTAGCALLGQTTSPSYFTRLRVTVTYYSD